MADGLINCKKCGTLFFKTSGREICEECFKKELDLIDNIWAILNINTEIWYYENWQTWYVNNYLVNNLFGDKPVFYNSGLCHMVKDPRIVTDGGSAEFCHVHYSWDGIFCIGYFVCFDEQRCVTQRGYTETSL